MQHYPNQPEVCPCSVCIERRVLKHRKEVRGSEGRMSDDFLLSRWGFFKNQHTPEQRAELVVSLRRAGELWGLAIGIRQEGANQREAAMLVNRQLDVPDEDEEDFMPAAPAHTREHI